MSDLNLKVLDIKSVFNSQGETIIQFKKDNSGIGKGVVANVFAEGHPNRFVGISMDDLIKLRDFIDEHIEISSELNKIV